MTDVPSLARSNSSKHRTRLPLLLTAALGREHRHEGLLRDAHAGGAHRQRGALLARLLLLEQLALSRDVTAIALRDHVFTNGAHRRPRDHPAPDRRLDRDGELLARDELLELLGQLVLFSKVKIHHPSTSPKCCTSTSVVLV